MKMHTAVVIGTAAVLAVLSGCTLGIPSKLAMATPGATTQPPKPPSLPPLQVGVDLAVQRDYQDSQVQSWGSRDIAYMANVLHVQSVGIDWNLEVPSASPEQVQESSVFSATPHQIQMLTSIAKSYKLRVQYRVLFLVTGSHKSLRPSQSGTFFANLLATEGPYLRVAQQEGVSEFVAGTEQAPIERLPGWTGFLADAAKIYHGVLSYALWGGEPHDGGVFWGAGCEMPIKLCGVTFYPNLTVPSHATVAQLTSAWETDLKRLPARTLRTVEIDETGIAAVDNAYKNPWYWGSTQGAVITHQNQNDLVQANWYTAACAAARAEGLLGIEFWWMRLDADPASAPALPTDFTGRAASVAAIRKCAQDRG